MPRPNRKGLSPAEVARLSPAAQAQINQQTSDQQTAQPSADPSTAQRDLQTRLQSSGDLLRQTRAARATSDAARQYAPGTEPASDVDQATPQPEVPTQPAEQPAPVRAQPTGPVEKPNNTQVAGGAGGNGGDGGNGNGGGSVNNQQSIPQLIAPIEKMVIGLQNGIAPNKQEFLNRLMALASNAKSLGPNAQNYVAKYMQRIAQNPHVLAAFPELQRLGNPAPTPTAPTAPPAPTPRDRWRQTQRDLRMQKAYDAGRQQQPPTPTPTSPTPPIAAAAAPTMPTPPLPTPPTPTAPMPPGPTAPPTPTAPMPPGPTAPPAPTLPTAPTPPAPTPPLPTAPTPPGPTPPTPTAPTPFRPPSTTESRIDRRTTDQVFTALAQKNIAAGTARVDYNTNPNRQSPFTQRQPRYRATP